MNSTSFLLRFFASPSSVVVLACLALTSSGSVEAQFVYGDAGTLTPSPKFATGLPVFDYPRPVMPAGFDDMIQLASDKKLDPKQQVKETRERPVAKEKHADSKKDAPKEPSKKREGLRESVKPNSDEGELRLQEPVNRERTIDMWDRDLPTERPKQDQSTGPSARAESGWSEQRPDAHPPMEHELLELQRRRAQLMQELGAGHPRIRELNAMIEHIEREPQRPRVNQPRQGIGPQGIGPQGIGPQGIGPQGMGENPHRPHSNGPHEQQIDSVGELKRTIESIDRIVERLAQKRQANKHKNVGDQDEEDDDDDSNVEQIADLIESQLELRNHLKAFQVEMMRIELKRAELEAELFEEAVETLHKVRVLELISR